MVKQGHRRDAEENYSQKDCADGAGAILHAPLDTACTGWDACLSDGLRRTAG